MCPARSHSRETDGKFGILPQSANADSSLKEGAKDKHHLSQPAPSEMEPFIFPPISTKQTNRLLVSENSLSAERP